MRTFTSTDRLAHDLTGIENGRESFVWAVPLPDRQISWFNYLWRSGETGKWGRFIAIGGPKSPTPIVFDVQDGLDMVGEDLTHCEIGGLRIEQDGELGSTTIGYSSDDVSFEFTTRPRTSAFSWHDGKSGCPVWAAAERYEISTENNGRLSLDGDSFSFSDFGHHDHSWGGRDWRALQHWKWINIGTDDVAIHAWESHALGARQVNGYVQRDGELSPIDELEIETRFDNPLVQRSASISIVDREGRKTAVELENRATARVPVSHLYMTEVAASAVVDGAPGTAIFECSFPKSYVDSYDVRGDDK